MTEQSRTTHPAWSYRNPERKINTDELLNNPLENVALHFHNNINTRLLERDNFKPRFPSPRNN